MKNSFLIRIPILFVFLMSFACTAPVKDGGLNQPG